MKKLLIAPIVLALAACGSSDQPEQEASPAAEGEVTAEATADTAAPASAEAAVGAPAGAAAPPATGGLSIRGPGGLEERCLARVDSETDGSGVSTNRIEEVESAVAIYVNVPGAEAPWRCMIDRDGTIRDLMYTGSEGAM